MKVPTLLGLALIVLGVLLIAGDALRPADSAKAAPAATTPAPRISGVPATTASPVALGVLMLAAGVLVLVLGNRR